MKRTLAYTGLARSDLEEIFTFIAADNPTRAGSYVAEIQNACKNLCETPFIGMGRPNLQPDLRIFTLWRRVVIAYRVLPTQVEILRIFTSGRDFETIMESI